MKQCLECSGQLKKASFAFERAAHDGRLLREEVAGFLCPSCGEQVLRGRDAERLSHAWYQLAFSRSPAPAVSTEGTFVPGALVVTETPAVERILVSTSLS